MTTPGNAANQAAYHLPTHRRFPRRNAIDSACHPAVAEAAAKALERARNPPGEHDSSHMSQSLSTLSISTSHPPSTTRLCDYCRSITIEALSAVEGYAYFPSPAEAVKSHNRCDFCGYMFTTWAHGFLAEWAAYRRETGDHRGLTVHLETRDNGCACSEVAPRLEGEPKAITFTRYFAFRVRAAQDDVAVARYDVLPEGDPSPGSPYTLDLARMWLANCRDLHACGEPLPYTDENDAMPSRLLDLGEFEHDVRLVQASEITTSKEYAALSHCWGPGGLPNSSKLTTTNIGERRARIEYSSLPLNMQHAITVTRELGMRYIWVDALCILQDSRDDWHKESAKMATVYSRAAVTIAAAITGDSDGGCFTKVERPQTLEDGFVAGVCIFEVPNPIVITNVLSTGEASTLHFYARTWPQKLDPWFSEGPLAKRGWTLQENIMSARILHFTPAGVFWQCREEYRSEEGYHFIQGKLTTDKLTPSTIASLFCVGRDDDDTRSARRMFSFVLWYNRIVPDYTRRTLTFASDKLAAISSIARAMAWQTRWTYLAGLWSRRIAWGLTWEAKDFRGAVYVLETPPLGQLPSWSWVSHEYEVHWPKLSDEEEKAKPGWQSAIGGTEWTMEASEVDTLVGVSRAEITIEARTKTAYLCSKRNSPDRYGDMYVAGKTPEGKSFTLLESFQVRLDIHLPPQEVLLLMLLRRTYPAAEDCCVLLLIPVDESREVYRRVGITKAGYGNYDRKHGNEKVKFFEDFYSSRVQKVRII